MTSALRARAAFAVGYGEFGPFPMPVGAVALCQAIEASPYGGPELEPLVMEAGRRAGARAAREKSHDGLYDYHRQELGALLVPILGRLDHERVAAEMVGQAQTQTKAGAGAVARHAALAPIALAAIHGAVDHEDRAALSTLNAAGWSHATATGQAEATATPPDGGTPNPAKVGGFTLAGLAAMPTSAGVAETVGWTDAELATVAMGAAMAAGDGKAYDEAVRKVVGALSSPTRAQRLYAGQLHQALNQAFVARTQQTFGTPTYAWVINSGNPCPTCTALAAGGPYKASALPTTPPIHPNCLCNLEIVSAALAPV